MTLYRKKICSHSIHDLVGEVKVPHALSLEYTTKNDKLCRWCTPPETSTDKEKLPRIKEQSSLSDSFAFHVFRCKCSSGLKTL